VAVTKSFLAKPDQVPQDWLLIDADDQVVGRLAVKLATILMGKHKPTYTPHVDVGDFVVVINCEKVKFGGRRVAHPTHPGFSLKMLSKQYKRFTGYTDGLKFTSAAEMWEKKPEEILRLAVRRMLPKTRMGRAMLKKLKLFKGPKHDHQAQDPKPYALK
jgi:large subunit ribosomal protein L13